MEEKMTENKKINLPKRVSLVFLQFLGGCIVGVIAYLVLRLLTDLLWIKLQQVDFGGFLTAIFLLISFFIVYFGSIVAAAEGVRQTGRLLKHPGASEDSMSLRRIYEGSFLGLCAAVALLSVTRGDWAGTLQEWGNPIKAIGEIVYKIIVPIKFLTFGFSEDLALPSAIFIIIISAPIGAIISYNVKSSVREQKKIKSDEIVVEQSEDKKKTKKGKK